MLIFRRSLTIVITLVVIALIILLSTYYFVYLPTTTRLRRDCSFHPAELPLRDRIPHPIKRNLAECHSSRFDVDRCGSCSKMKANSRLFSANESIHGYQLPGAQKKVGRNLGMTIQNSKNLVWFTEAVSDAVWKLQHWRRTSLRSTQFTRLSFPFGIVIDKQGNVWFTELKETNSGR